MGVALWALAGLAAFLAARAIRTGRCASRKAEFAASVVAALAFGALATALDFGGWAEPDWRAITLAFLGAFTAAGAVRAVHLWRSR